MSRSRAPNWWRNCGNVSKPPVCRPRSSGRACAPPGSNTANAATASTAAAAGRQLSISYEPDGSTLFGYALFSQPTTMFDENAGGPVDASFKLGAGDQLVSHHGHR